MDNGELIIFMSKMTHNVTATIGEYTDREGNTKKRYMKCGAAFTGDDGRMSIKLDAVPCGEWSGWFNLYPKEEERAAVSTEPARAQAPDRGDEIPF